MTKNILYENTDIANLSQAVNYLNPAQQLMKKVFYRRMFIYFNLMKVGLKRLIVPISSAAALFVLLTCPAYAAKSISLSEAPSSVQAISIDESGVILKMEIGKIDFVPVSTAEGSFFLAKIDGFSRSFNIGKPNLPIAAKLLSIPFGCELDYEIISSEIREYRLDSLGVADFLMPAQPSLSKSEDPANVPFEFKREIYAQTGYYSLPLIETEITGIMRGVRIGRIAIAPLEYNPAENSLKVHNNIAVKVHFRNPDWELTEEIYRKNYSPVFEPVYSQIVSYPAFLLTAKAGLEKYPIKYLIISDRMFENQLQPFILWKIQKGFNVVVAYTDIIGTTNVAIKNYIQSVYEAGTPDDPAPSYVLFVGDAQQIPPFNGSTGAHITDKKFCEFTGDLYPEIYYGRFSAQDSIQLQPQIDKTIEYEKYLMPDPSYLAEVALVSGVDDTYAEIYGNGQINYGTDYYFNAAHGITPNVWLYPASAQSGAAAEIIQTIGDGIGLYNYTAHCSHEGHADPPFNKSDILELKNYHKYLLGIGNCCLANTFGSNYATPCFGEAFLQAAEKGGIGYIGGSNSTYWDEDYWWGVGFGPINGSGPSYEETGLGAYDGLFHAHGEELSSHYVTNDAVIFCGNLAVSASSSDRKAYYWEIYHLMGDPSVMTYMGLPDTNDVAHPSAIISTAPSMTVTADPESYVGVSFNGVLHGAGFIDSSGFIDLPLDPFSSPGLADIVVTAQNRIPYISTIQIALPAGPYVAYAAHNINDVGGNNDGVINCGEPISLGISLINVGSDTAFDVSAVLTATNPYITVTDSVENYGAIAGDSGLSYIADGFSFTVADSAPDNQIINFTLSISASGEEDVWTGHFSIMVRSPKMEFVSVVVTEISGNGNGNFEPGEIGEAVVVLSNSGSADGISLTGILYENDDFLTINDDVGTFGSIVFGGVGSNSADPFIVAADPGCPFGHSISMQIAIMGNGYSGRTTFNLVVGDRAVFFFDDFSVNAGWTGLGGAGEWTIGTAAGGVGSDMYGGPDPSEDHSSNADNRVLGNDLETGTGGDYNPNIAGTDWITSPIFDCREITGVQLRFWRWLGIENSSYDHVYLQAYDGSAWRTVYQNGAAVNDTVWTEQVFDLSDYADGNIDFQIRFGIGPTDGNQNYCGWNIDDLELKGYGEIPGGIPQMVYSPNEIADSVDAESSIIDTLKIYNTGDGLLRVSLSSSASWLSINSEQLNVSAGDSSLFQATINTAGLAPGDYADSLKYLSNDPLRPSGFIPISLHVLAPDILIAPPAIADTVARGDSTTTSFVINNNGPGKLYYYISRVTFNGKSEAAEAAKAVQFVEPLGYRVSDEGKGAGETEPFYSEATQNNGGPDNHGYSWIDSDDAEGPAFNWIDISSIGAAATLGDDDSTAAIPIGFDFPFYENSYNALHIGSNGILTFGKGSISRVNTGLPNVTTPNNLIAVWWDDLDPSKGGHILYYYDAVNARFIVNFDSIPNYHSTTGTGSLTFQAILYPDGKIIMQYLNMDAGIDIDSMKGATIGIEDSAGIDGLTAVYNAPYMHDTLAILFAAAEWLSASPVGGAIEAYAADTILVTLKASELQMGTYGGKLTVNSNDPETPAWDIPTTMTVVPNYVCGDADGNGTLNAIDVTYLINFLYKGGGAPIPIEAGDASGNGIINALDVTYLINYLYKGGGTPICP
jgi:hypothetical protein